ncbi:Utp21-domain-containing protein [Ramaria rubella]|nr:Utp21-domain-containing protein [Ramaria rubella]
MGPIKTSSLVSPLDESSRPRKRPKHSDVSNSDHLNTGSLFAPFRALGFVTDHVPFILQVRTQKGASQGPRVHLLTCLGHAWALWEGGKMTLLFVGPDVEEGISSLAMEGDAVWAAHGIHASKYLRGKEVTQVSNPLGTRLSSLLTFGFQLLALTEDGRHLLTWNTELCELVSTITFDPDFTATSMLHPATYLNKILVGSSQGSLQLWNIRTQSCIHRFSPATLQSSPTSATSPSPVTSMVQSPAIDVVGVGFASGEISIYDIRADERLLRIFMDGGAIRSLGFRSDNHAVLASASSTGHVALWDLNHQGRLLHIIRGAHDGAVSTLEWIPSQPVLVTSGDDNSVKQWLFDSPTAPPRLLKFRSGHHTPPHLIRYYGVDGKQLLTASRDRSLRCTSVVRDSRSFELSQGALMKKATSLSIPITNLKFPAVSSLAFSSTRSKDWEDVLTAHTDESFARTWSVLNKKVGRWTFGTADKGKAGSVKAVCVSACGNFGIAGSSTGMIHMWNMQSGIRRKTYNIGPAPPEVASRGFGRRKKERSIIGLASDVLDRVVVACTLDGTLNFFDFHTTALEHVLILPCTAVQILLQRDSNLLAVVCDDLVVRVVDIETRRIVRELRGFRGRILDIAFSPDSRWLITTSLDSTIRTFDVPTGRLIDIFRTASVATSVAFSPTSDFLATSHVDSVGVYLWANRAQYGEVSFKTVPDQENEAVALPSMRGLAEDDALEGLASLVLNEETDLFITPEQLDGELVTLTLLPRSRWQTLLNLETIQQRNKPKEPPKAPAKAPFFIPTLPGVEHRFDLQAAEAKASDAKKPTRRLDAMAAGMESEFQTLLAAAEPEGDYEAFFAYVKMLSPAAIDLELRTLTSLKSLRLFLGALTQRLRSHRDFEAVQTFLNVFLRIQGDVLVENTPELRDPLHVLQEIQKAESSRIVDQISAALGTLAFVRDAI